MPKRRSEIEVEKHAPIVQDAVVSIHMMNDLMAEQGYIVWALVEGKERSGKLLATSTSTKRLVDYALHENDAKAVVQNFHLGLVEHEL